MSYLVWKLFQFFAVILVIVTGIAAAIAVAVMVLKPELPAP